MKARRVFVMAAALGLGLAASGYETTLGGQPHAIPDSVVAELRKGGLVLVFRHAHTDRSKMEGDDFSLNDRSTQRNLSDLGVAQSKSIGAGLTGTGVGVGQVLASPMFRTRETAELAFARVDTTELLRTQRRSTDALALLTEAPEPGVNRVLVTHNGYIMHHFGKMGHGQIAEGEVIIVRPLGADGYRVLGRVKADDWEHIRTHRH